MEPLGARFRTNRLLPAACAVAALGSVGLGLVRDLPASSGLLAVGLPWLSACFYAAWTVLAAAKPESRWNPRAAAAAAGVHAALLMELMIDRRFCVGCLVVAGLGAACVVLAALSRRETAVGVAAALAIGAVLGRLSPVDPLDVALTRLAWPSKILSQAPAFADRATLSGCLHGTAVRILLYEKDCKG